MDFNFYHVQLQIYRKVVFKALKKQTRSNNLFVIYILYVESFQTILFSFIFF